MILLTGATGTVGRHAVLELKIRKVPFRVLTRDADRARTVLGPVDCALGDLSRPETVAKALDGVSAALLLSPVDPSLVSWEAGFARAAKKAGVKRLVKLSALGADANSAGGLARWHGDAEAEIERSGVPFVHLRPAAFYQNLLGSVPGIRRGVLAAPMGSARIAMVDARDVGATAAAVLTGAIADGATLTLTGPAALTYAEIAAALTAVLVRPVSYSDQPPADALRGMLNAGYPAWLADAVLELAERFRAGKADLVADGVREATARAPHSLESFLRAHRTAFA